MSEFERAKAWLAAQGVAFLVEGSDLVLTAERKLSRVALGSTGVLYFDHDGVFDQPSPSVPSDLGFGLMRAIRPVVEPAPRGPAVAARLTRRERGRLWFL